MENTQNIKDFDLETLQFIMNSYSWHEIDTSIHSLPTNPNYQVIIDDPQSNHPHYKVQKYYQRFRFIMENENTHFLPQTLAMTTYLLKASTNNYYALMLRKKYVFNELLTSKISKNCEESSLNEIKMQIFERELNFMNNLLDDNPKEYHIWTYKKDLISKTLAVFQQQSITQQAISIKFRQSLYKKENEFIFALLIEDCRNYHAWDYRFWLVTFLNKIQMELQWINDLIAEEKKADNLIEEIKDKLQGSQFSAKLLKPNWVNVNSLWSHKFNLIKYMKDLNDKIQKSEQIPLRQQDHFCHKELAEMVDRQILASIGLIENNRSNECIWNFLKGMMKFQQNNKNGQKFKQENLNRIRDKIFQLKSWEDAPSVLDKLNRFELSFLKFLLPHIVPQPQIQYLHKKIISQLKMIDSVRIKYYDYQERKIEQK